MAVIIKPSWFVLNFPYFLYLIIKIAYLFVQGSRREGLRNVLYLHQTINIVVTTLNVFRLSSLIG